MEKIMNMVSHPGFYVAVAEFAIIGICLWLFYKRFIRHTASEKLVRGLLGLAVLWVASFALMYVGLGILGVFAQYVAIFLSVGLVVIFQPELRKFLGMMGQVKFLAGLFSKKVLDSADKKSKLESAAAEIIKAAEYMSAKHIGALIVFQDGMDGGVKNYGTIVNADITSELLLTIFFPKTSLHDGAVVISNMRIYSAGAILPLTENRDLHWQYGTRHRAAIGLSEVSDATVLAVSEETGNISISRGGKISHIESAAKLKSKIIAAMSKV
ncbi:MAG: diadenylate cyclase [Rickettsiales bacterium]|jgi:diadenylate cyclase|nr:diadenylate cyclase [Rickettsiales bacterium]